MGAKSKHWHRVPEITELHTNGKNREEIATILQIPPSFVKLAIKQILAENPAARQDPWLAKLARNPNAVADLKATMTPESEARRLESIRSRYALDPGLRKLKSKNSKDAWARISEENLRGWKEKHATHWQKSPRKLNTEKLELLCKARGFSVSGPATLSHDSYTWTCDKGHSWKALYNSIQQGSGCPQCCSQSHISVAETEILQFVKQYYPAAEKSRTVISPKEIDIFIPELNLGIEHDGLYWHSELMHQDKFNILDKQRLMKEKGCRLISMFEDEWTLRNQAVKSYLSAILGKKDSIGARKCLLERRPAPEFFDAWHLQGNANGEHYLLVYNGQIVAAAAFGIRNASRGGKDKVWELLRYCASDISVQGGASRLISAWKAAHPNEPLLSYSDNRWSNGNLYIKLGFDKKSINRPCYWYFKKGKKVRRHRYAYAKHKLVASGADQSRTEWEIMQDNGFNRVWDAGTTTWLLNP